MRPLLRACRRPVGAALLRAPFFARMPVTVWLPAFEFVQSPLLWALLLWAPLLGAPLIAGPVYAIELTAIRAVIGFVGMAPD